MVKNDTPNKLNVLIGLTLATWEKKAIAFVFEICVCDRTLESLS
jgi:hypothetical protein